MNSLSRIWHSFRLATIKSSGGRAEYIKQHHLFHSMGEGCTFMKRKLPLCPELISIGNNVHLASGAELVVHDAIHLMLNGRHDGYKYQEHIGCIEIGNNVFIGSDTIVLGDVKIGSNVVVAAGAVVNKDIPSGCVVGGVPARYLGSFEDIVNKRKKNIYPENILFSDHNVSEELENWMWNNFETSNRDSVRIKNE